MTCYFGDSRDSIGIQMADLCILLYVRHLLKKNGTEGILPTVSG